VLEDTGDVDDGSVNPRAHPECRLSSASSEDEKEEAEDDQEVETEIETVDVVGIALRSLMGISNSSEVDGDTRPELGSAASEKDELHSTEMFKLIQKTSAPLQLFIRSGLEPPISNPEIKPQSSAWEELADIHVRLAQRAQRRCEHI